MQEESLPRNFKGIWIPKEIWLHTELSFFEKMLWAEIDSLDDGEIGCFASNPYFMKFFTIKERMLQLALSKLKNLGLIYYLPSDGRRRFIRSSITTSHEKFDTPGVQNITPQRCNSVHPENKAYKKEEKDVCYPTAVAADIEKSPSKEELKKEILKETKRGLSLPSTLVKKHADGHDITFSLEEMFRKSVMSKKDFKTSEVHDSWIILSEYQGVIRDPFAFIEGTIKNFRNAEKSNYLTKNGNKSWKKKNSNSIEETTQSEKSIECKESKLEKDISELPCLLALFEKELGPL